MGVHLQGRLLTMTQTAQELTQALKTLEPQINLYSPPKLKEANLYETTLKKHQVSANESFHELAQGIYPIDLEHLNTLCQDNLPKNLEDLYTEPTQTPRNRLPITFHLAILTCTKELGS